MKITKLNFSLKAAEVTLIREYGKNRSLFLKVDGINSYMEICLDKEDINALRELLNREDNQHETTTAGNDTTNVSSYKNRKEYDRE